MPFVLCVGVCLQNFFSSYVKTSTYKLRKFGRKKNREAVILYFHFTCLFTIVLFNYDAFTIVLVSLICTFKIFPNQEWRVSGRKPPTTVLSEIE